MWRKLGQFIYHKRLILLTALLFMTVFMGYHASKVKLSYEFVRAIPTDNPKYIAFQEFRKKYGEDGNLMVLGVQTEQFFDASFFNKYKTLHHELKKLNAVEEVISIVSAVNLVKNYETEKLEAKNIFENIGTGQQAIDSGKNVFLNLPFYQNRIYNLKSNAWLMGVKINNEVMNSKDRAAVVSSISKLANEFSFDTQTQVYKSGLPLIRTEMATRIADEMKWFLLASALLCAIILLLFFRSLSSMLLSLAVVSIGVVWSLGTMHLLGYNITLLTALIPPLVVVIGIPNCIYFLNKYHTSYNQTGDKNAALILMVEKMGIVTLFCNLTAAIGFAVFALTKSAILQEFGVVAGINIMALFFISLIIIPAVLAYLPKPKSRHTKYLHNANLHRWLDRLERWSLNHRRLIFVTTVVIMLISITGMTQLKSVGYIVDDIPKTDKLYTDLKFFEHHFSGVMPLEILVNTHKKYGVSRNLNNLERIDSLTQYMQTISAIGKPLSIVDGLKFAKQAFFEGDSLYYSMPSEFDLPGLSKYLTMRKDSTAAKNSFAKIVSSFMDEDKMEARISVNMQDVGSLRLPQIIDSIQKRSDQLFAKDKYDVQFTGTSITFLEGSRFIINGLKESILWAFLFIAICMFYLFRSWRILITSLIPNVIPLIITAGVMGWTGVPLKPSTVLIFSVALGIAIDITIRFLVNYKQELRNYNNNIEKTVIQTIHSTGISIIYTSMVLIVGFVIFCFSGFGGTQSLGWLTSLTLITATLTNLVLLPAILIGFGKDKQ